MVWPRQWLGHELNLFFVEFLFLIAIQYSGTIIEMRLLVHDMAVFTSHIQFLHFSSIPFAVLFGACTLFEGFPHRCTLGAVVKSVLGGTKATGVRRDRTSS